MPGFGSSPFGNSPFGHYPWSKTILYDYVPELHRVQDEANDFTLRKWADSQRYSYDGLLNKIFLFDTLRDPRYVRTQYSEVYTVSLGAEVLEKPKIEQRNLDGQINSFREFVAQSARFTDEDVGKVLAITRSSVTANNREYTIARIADGNTAILDPLPSALDTGSDRWELRKKTGRREDVITLQVRDGDMSVIAPGYILNDGFADYTVLARRLFERSEDLKHLTVREGADGSIDGSGRFVSPTLSALPSDEGKYIFIDGVDTADPKRVIERVVPGLAGTTAEIGGTALATNAGPLTWALLPFPEIDIAAIAPPKGVVEQEGSDMTLTASHAFSSPTLRLTSDDVGKFLVTRGASNVAANNRVVKIATVVSPTAGTKDTTYGDGSTAFANASGITWEIRSATEIATRQDVVRYGNSSTPSFGVTVRASSLITEFTKDFGISTDEQETERRQRNWLRHVTQWIDKKGTARAYESLSRVTGVDSAFTPLYAIDQQNADELDSFYLPFPDWNNPLTGTDGSLLDVSGDVVFTTPTGVLPGGVVGHYLKIQGSGSTNSKIFEIKEKLSSGSLRLVGTFGTIPDPNNGALTWKVVSYYTTIVPTRVLGDDVNVDLLSEIVSAAISAGPGSGLVDGDTFQLSDGVGSETYEFDSNASVTPGNIAVTFTGGQTAAQVAATITATINASTTLQIMAFQKAGRETVSLAHAQGKGYQIFGSGNALITEDTPLPFFYPDYLCRTPGFSTEVPLYVIAATQVNVLLFTVDVIGTALFTDSPEAVAAIGNWYIKDSAGAEFFLESVPTLNGVDGVSGRPQYTFQVAATAAPAVSRVTPANFDYRCELVLDCGFCATKKLVVEVEPNSELLGEGAVALEGIEDRAAARLEQAKPAHVEFVFYAPEYAYLFGGIPFGTANQPLAVGYQIERWDYSAETSYTLENGLSVVRFGTRPFGNFELAVIPGGDNYDYANGSTPIPGLVEKFNYATQVATVSASLDDIPDITADAGGSASTETKGIHVFQEDASGDAWFNTYAFSTDTWTSGGSLAATGDNEYYSVFGNTEFAWLVGDNAMRKYAYANDAITDVTGYLPMFGSYEQSVGTPEYAVYWGGNSATHDWLGIYVYATDVAQSAAVSLGRYNTGIASARQYIGAAGNGSKAAFFAGDSLYDVSTGWGPSTDNFVSTVSTYDYATQVTADIGNLRSVNVKGAAVSTKPSHLLAALFATPAPEDEGMTFLRGTGAIPFTSVGTIDMKIPTMARDSTPFGYNGYFMLGTINIAVPSGDLASNYDFTLPAGWTLIRKEFVGRKMSAAFYRFSSSEPSAYAVVNTFPANCYGSAFVSVYTKVDPVHPIVDHAFTSTTGTSINAPSVLTEAPYGRLVSIVACDTTLNPTEPLTMIQRQKDGDFTAVYRFGIADENIPHTGSTGVRTWTLSASASAMAISISLRREV